MRIKNRVCKITLITLGSLLGIVVLTAALALWLVFTPSQLTKIVNRVAERYVLAETHFESVDLTLFKTFPDAGLKVDNVYLVNPMEGAPSDTVARIGSLTLGVDVRAYLKEKKVIVHQVLLDDVDADLYIDKAGRSNFDVFPRGSDTTSSPFSLDSLPLIDLRKIVVSAFGARLLDEKDGLDTGVEGLDLDIAGRLEEGLVDADLTVGAKAVALARFNSLDSAGSTLEVALQDMALALKGKGNMEDVEGRLKLEVASGEVRVGESDMVNETLQSSKNDLLSLQVPFKADLQKMHIELGESRMQLDDYALDLEGQVQLATAETPLALDMALNTDGAWHVAPLLSIVPERFTAFAKGMDMDGKVQLAATAKGTVTDSTMPRVDAKVKLADGRFSYPKALPYKINKIKGDLVAVVDMSRGGKSHVVVNSLSAHTRGTDLKVRGRADDLLGDMGFDVTVEGRMPLEDAMPMVPEKLKLTADGTADLDLRATFSMSQLKAKSYEKMAASGTVKFKDLDVRYDSIRAVASALDVALTLPAKEHKGRLADVRVESGECRVENGKHLKAVMEKADIEVSVNNPMAEQLAATFAVTIGESEANLDSTMVSLEALVLKGTMRMDSLQSNPLRKYNPVADVALHSAVLYMPTLPDAVRLSEFKMKYDAKSCDLSTAELKLGHSDFQLYGSIDNLEAWLDHKEILQADLNFTSNYADVDHLMSMFSGMGSDKDSLEQMRQEDKVAEDAAPFIVPKDVDLTLHTHIKRSVAFGNDLNDVAGALTIKDGVAILDQIGFVCKAATMQLTALYKSPRPNNLFCALDFHLLDIQVDELIDMIPTVDSLVPMLAAFDGKANFHLAGETYLDARYRPKMSSLLGSAAISGRYLTVLDNSSISQIAKLMQFKSWKDKDDKIKIDSLDVEMTCFRKEVEVYPFLLNIGKYQICASGKHTLDNQCGYHVELLKNPLLAKVGVDIRGDIRKPSISLGKVRYADLYKPEKQGVVEKRTLELKRMIREALERNVR